MKVLGFNFNKISVEKFSGLPKAEELKINTNINIIDITSVKSDLIKTKEELIGVKFNYSIDYEPNFAKLDFSGDILIELDAKLQKDILRDWKTKDIPEEFKIFVFNIVLLKVTVKSLELEESTNIPFHMPLPSIPTKGKEKKPKQE